MIDRRTFCLALTTSLLVPSWKLKAQDSGFQPRTFKNASNESLPYRLFIPLRYEKAKHYPLVLALHGGAGRGTDNLKQISAGNYFGSHVWTTAAAQANSPCFVLAPQCPEEQMWTSIEKVRPSRPLDLAVELLDEINRSFSVDQNRIYVTGQSMGGFATWALIAAHPNRFAAAVPICGGGDESQATKLTKTPVWAFHGSEDQSVSITRSRTMIEAIKRAGGNPKFTEYEHSGHVIWERVFAEPELLPWVFSQKRKQ
jgi:predicted peptidase